MWQCLRAKAVFLIRESESDQRALSVGSIVRNGIRRNVGIIIRPVFEDNEPWHLLISEAFHPKRWVVAWLGPPGCPDEEFFRVDIRTEIWEAKDLFGMASIAEMAECGVLAISCLLYTSPSPRDYAASRMPSSA